MARIRSIKPEFPQSESMGRVSRDARLLFVMLWPICDDHGRTRAASRMLASLLFPYDSDAPALMDGWLSELEREGCIRRYVVDGSTYLEVCNWLKHQKIDKPSKPQFPEFSGTLASPREDSRILPVGKEGKGEERKGEEKRESARATRLPQDWQPSPDELAWARNARPDVDPAAEAAKFRDYWHAKGGKDAAKADWSATWRNWIRNAHAPPRRATPPTSQSKQVQALAAILGVNHESNDPSRLVLDLDPVGPGADLRTLPHGFPVV